MKRTAVAVLAAASLVIAGCSDDDDPVEGTDGTQVEGQGTRSEAELVADATTVAVAYFQARSVHDFETALDNSHGAATLVIDWDQAVAGIDGLEGTPYEVTPVEAPEVRVNISAMEEGAEGTYSAEGFVELGHRPSGVASTTTTEPPEGAEDLGEVTFVTDLEFVRDGDTLRLSDYRFDDVEYPVSELYVAGESEASDQEGDSAGEGADDRRPSAGEDTDTGSGSNGVPGSDDGATTGGAQGSDATATTVAGEGTDDTTAGEDAGTSTTADDTAEADDTGVKIVMGHRDVDGSVQWIVDHDDDAEVLEALFIEGEEPPAADASGVELQVFPTPGTSGDVGVTEDPEGVDATVDDSSDREGDGPTADTLVVHAGAFPGETPGTVRFQVAVADGGEGPVVADVEALEFPELGAPRATNVIRDSERDVDDTTTTTEPEDDTTTSTEPEQEEEVESTPTTGGTDQTTTTADSTTSTSAMATTSTTSAGES